MNPLFEYLLKSGMPLDCLGLLGIGFVGLAATRLAARYRSWGGTMMASGAISVLLARFYFIIAPQVMTRETLDAIGAVPMELIAALVPLLLSFGLAGVVWGLWCHERWLHRGD